MNSGMNSKQRAHDTRVLNEVTEEAVEGIKKDDMLARLFSRRAVLRNLSGSALAVMAGLAVGEAVPAQAQTTTGGSIARDIDILNFALNDEYLESEFYSYATSGQGIETFGVGITGQNGTGATATPGTTTGGGAVNFTDPTIKAIALQLADDERKHVNFVRQTITSLGGTPIARPNLNVAALAQKLNVDPAAQSTFLIGGRSFCDVGVSAYAGTSKYLLTPAVIQGAARILAVEAYHAGNLRLLIAQGGYSDNPLDAEDVPPPITNPNYFYVDPTGDAYAVIRTVLQVLGVFYLQPDSANPTPGGFFPNGVNANAASLLALPS